MDASIGGMAAAILLAIAGERSSFRTARCKPIYPGQPWIFDWTVRGSNCSALVFEWRRHGADELTRRVVLRNDPSLRRVGGVPSKRRSCTLPWTSSEAPRGAQPSPPRAQPSPHHGTQLTILSDTWRAYDWMRYDFTVWAEAVSARLMHLGPPAPLVIIDPMCGGGWMPLLLKARLGPAAHIVCSHVLQGSVDEARANFEAKRTERHLRRGDLFQPTRAAIDARTLARAAFAYVYPPQEALDEAPTGSSPAVMDQPTARHLHSARLLRLTLLPSRRY